MNLELPKKIYMNTNFDDLLDAVHKMEIDEEALLSFKNVEFVLPETTIMLIAISQQIYVKTGKNVVWTDLQDNIRLYLERIQIESIPFIEVPRKSSLWKKRIENSLVEMKIMTKPNQVDEMISDTKRVLYQWFPERNPEQYVKQISEYIRHIAGNSLEHSDSKHKGICYYTLQRYNPSHKSASIHVAFGDVGMGIANSLDKTYPWIIEQNRKAVEMAFIKGLSCRGMENGGLGFRTVKQHLQNHGGEILIRSGNEILRYIGSSGRYTVKKFKNSIIGTQTLIILK